MREMLQQTRRAIPEGNACKNRFNTNQLGDGGALPTTVALWTWQFQLIGNGGSKGIVDLEVRPVILIDV
jgi:hypothetical protein